MLLPNCIPKDGDGFVRGDWPTLFALYVDDPDTLNRHIAVSPELGWYTLHPDAPEDPNRVVYCVPQPEKTEPEAPPTETPPATTPVGPEPGSADDLAASVLEHNKFVICGSYIIVGT